jgi:hypothetical protein
VVATASSADPHLSDSDMPYVEPPAAVGWVFGRVMGFPGADRPLMSGSYPTMPPAVRSASALAGPRQ